MAVAMSSVKLFKSGFAVRHRSCFLFARSSSSGAISSTAESNKSQFVQSHLKQEKGNEKTKHNFVELAEYRFTYPEFLPNPKFDLRHKIREKLEREDMLKRRGVIEIPEFYVGSILAVKTSDPFAPGKENRFVGICIARTYFGLRATFTLRNIVDNQGVEIMYDLYNPTIQQIEVLRLEKRLDDELYYLRDAPPEYSTFPFDMEPEFIAEGEPVRVNPLKVKLKPKPWDRKWQLYNLKGVEPFDEHLTEHDKRKAVKFHKPWEAYDLMIQYRQCIPEEDQQEIWEDVEEHRKMFQQKKQKWKQRVLQKAPKQK